MPLPPFFLPPSSPSPQRAESPLAWPLPPSPPQAPLSVLTISRGGTEDQVTGRKPGPSGTHGLPGPLQEKLADRVGAYELWCSGGLKRSLSLSPHLEFLPGGRMRVASKS